jgi:inorganic pyrophosphatase
VTAALLDIPAYAGDGALHVLVECPRGSRLKFDYDPELGVFEVGRPLPLGMSYPFDWGFIPGTRAPDGDPVDALVLHDVATYPGVLIKGRAVGMVKLRETPARSGRSRENHRIVLLPAWRDEHAAAAESLPAQVREQLEQFFVDVVKFTDKRVQVMGWASAGEADASVRSRRPR